MSQNHIVRYIKNNTSEDRPNRANISNFQDRGRFLTRFSWDFVWVNQVGGLNVSTNFRPVINFIWFKAICF